MYIFNNAQNLIPKKFFSYHSIAKVLVCHDQLYSFNIACIGTCTCKVYMWFSSVPSLSAFPSPFSLFSSSFFSSSLSPQVVGLNFSSFSTPELLLKTFDHYCEYKRTPNGVVMASAQLGKWLVLFCDEINLPDLDKYYGEREREKDGRGGEKER